MKIPYNSLDFSPSPRYCTFCGKAMIKANFQERVRFDSQTAERIKMKRHDFACPSFYDPGQEHDCIELGWYHVKE